MNFNLTIGELIQILLQVAAVVTIIAKLGGRIDRVSALFSQHEQYDKERFDELRSDVRQLQGHSFEG